MLFSICVFLFLLAAPTVILYSQGYRLDLNPPPGGKIITQTGAFYFKVAPKGAEIYLNGELKKTASGLTGSLLIENLSPKTYEIEIRKQGYYHWKKNLTIREKQVTEAKNIVLSPQNHNFSVFDENLPEIPISATSSDQTKLIERLNDYEIWILFLKDQYGQPQKKAGERVFLLRFSAKIGNVFWLNNDYLIFNVADKIKIAEIDDRDKLNIIDLAQFPSPQIFWDEKAKKLYISSENKTYLCENLFL